jgi:hypothetical protein
MLPQGQVEAAQVHLSLTEAQGLAIDANLDVRDVGWQDASHTTDRRLAYIQVQLQGSWHGQQWTGETLSVTVPDGHFALRNTAWLQVHETAWRGPVSFTSEVQDVQPIAHALGAFLPTLPHLSGRLQILGEVDGAISRQPALSWEARLAGLRVAFEGHLAGMQWGQETLTEITTRLHLEAGILTVSQASARVAGGEATLHGYLALTAGRSEGALEWHLANLSLHTLLGNPLQHFVVSQASGRISRDDQGYHLENTVHIPELSLLPAEIDARELRLTRATLHCTGTVVPSMTRLALTTCGLHATEAQLALSNGTLLFGPQPQLTVEVDGSLEGPFVNALAPEIPAQFLEPLLVRGPVTVPLHGKVWLGLQWHLAVQGSRFVFEDMVFTSLQATVVKSPGQLDIVALQAIRANGQVQAAGAWRLGGPADGSMQVHAEQVPLHKPLAPSATGIQYVIEGIASGSVMIGMGKDGVQLSVEHRVSSLRLRRDATTLAQVPMARIHGTFGRDRNDTWWARQLEVQAEALTLTIRHGRLQAQPTDTEDFQVEATLDAEGQWLTALLAICGVDGLVLSGRAQVTTQLQGRQNDVLKTTQGHGSLRIAQALFRDQTFTAVEIAYEITPGRLGIPHSVVGYREGTLTVRGSLGLPLPTGTPDDHLVVTLRQIPLSHTQQLASYRDQGPATLNTHTVLNGQVTFHSPRHGQLNGMMDVHTARTIRQIHQGDRRLTEIELPAFRLQGEVTTVRPAEGWDANTLRLWGDGLSLELKNASLRRDPAHYDLNGMLSLQATAQVANGLTIGLLPDTLELAGAVELVGTVGIRLPVAGDVQPQHLSYAGKLHLARVMLDDETLESLTAQVKMEQGKMTVAEGAVALHGGRLRLGSPSFVVLHGPPYNFRVHAVADQLELRVQSGKRLALSRLLLLFPLFILEPERDKPINISGRLTGELQLAGSYHTTPGWSKTVNGHGHFRIEHGEVVGSTLVSGFVSKVLLLPQNIVHNLLKELFARGGKTEQTLTSLGEKSFVFGTLESPIRVRAGVVRLQDNLTLTSPELSLVLNGSSTLEGDVDYHVRSDLIHRLRFGEITSLPNKLPLLGKALQYVNPFNLLEGIELEATVQGNVF